MGVAFDYRNQKMSNELQIYKFAPGMNLRTVVIDGEPWLVAKDVCASLGFRDASNTLLQAIASLIWPIQCASTGELIFACDNWFQASSMQTISNSLQLN